MSLVTSFSQPSALPVLAEALCSRPAARVVELPRPGEGEMRRLVAAIARAEGLALGRHALATIASHAHGDVRRAVGALTRHRFSTHAP